MLNLSVHINMIYIFILLCLFAKLDFCFRNFSRLSTCRTCVDWRTGNWSSWSV